MINNNIERNMKAVKDLKKITVFRPNDTVYFDASDVADYRYYKARNILQILKTSGELFTYCDIPYEFCFENQESLNELYNSIM